MHYLNTVSKPPFQYNTVFTQSTQIPTLTATTKSFIIHLKCINVADEECKFILTYFEKCALRIENSIYLVSKVRVSANYKSFCEEKSNCDDPSDNALGYAIPSYFVSWNNQSILPDIVDSKYLYPSALAKQLVPNDPKLNNTNSDISASFNSDYNWWFSNNDFGFRQNGQFGPSTQKNQNSSLKSYDFEQVVVHELLHGLGFVSSWNLWLGEEFFLPSYAVYDSYGILYGLSKSYIFDRWLSDSVNGFWMRDYASQIQKDLKISLLLQAESNETWTYYFRLLSGGKISKALASEGSPLLTPRGLWSWFPDLENGKITSRYSILYTPSVFDSGSSISHIDEHFYVSTSQYLMKPFGSRGAGLDGYTPYNKLGPLSETILGILRGMGYATI